MKRPVTPLLLAFACLALLCLQAEGAMGAEKRNSHVSGMFAMEIDGSDSGAVQSVEGGQAESEVVTEKPAPARINKTIAPPPGNTQLKKPPQPLPAQALQPACPRPPCGLGQRARQDENDSLSETAEEQQARLQAAQDRRAKTMETLSNTLKKQSDTQDGITGNMK